MRWIENTVYRCLGVEWCGLTGPPGDHLDYSLETWEAVHVSEDGFTLWIGTPDRWNIHLSRRDSHRLALWIIFRWWGLSEWFGLRRAIWFWALRRIVARTPSPREGADIDGA